jgi:hypothetical protein
MTANMFRKPVSRWTEITVCMIEKVPGCSRTNRLRVFHLYEADCNLILKIMWARETVGAVHNNKLLNNGQAGSRPGGRSIDVALRKEMKYNFSRLRRTPLATIDNNAKSCFDRILCNAALLVSKYFDVNEKCCKLQSVTLENTLFKMRTALGDSSSTYTYCEENPTHRTGQGSCARPAIWLLISSLLTDLIEKTLIA